MTQSRRRRMWMATVSLLVLGAPLLLVAFAKRDRYAFLDQFHPKRTYLDLERLATPASRALPRVREYILEFQDSESERVLTTLKGHLNPGNGFDIRDFGAGVRLFPDSKNDRVVMFTKSPIPPSVWITETLTFETGRSATHHKMQLIEAVKQRRTVSIHDDQVGPGSCIVIVTTGSNWLQDQIDKVNAFLHL